MKKRFITFEGGEGSGKSTILHMVSDMLKDADIDVVTTREPGGDDVAEDIRSVIMRHPVDVITEAYLFAAARASHIRSTIYPALENGSVVLCDRFLDSNLVYQGIVQTGKWEDVFEINKTAITINGELVLPTITFFLDVKPETGLARIAIAGRETNRFDQNALEFHQRVYDAYQKLTNIYQDRFIRINGNRDKEKIADEVFRIICDRFEL